MTEEELEQRLQKLVGPISENAMQVFNVATQAIMEQIPPGSMSSDDIIAGLEAALAIAEEHKRVSEESASQ